MHHRANSYSYPYPVPTTATTTTTTNNTPSKYQSSSHMHGTSSAFSANANPNEDWTKISDLAERRRIQNRIAQRNYRKKLKRRLEDLERRAASSSASPEQSHAEPEQPKSAAKSQSARSSTSSARSKQSSKTNNQWSAPENEMGMQQPAYGGLQEDRSMFGQQSTRQLSTSPPPFFYPSYPSYSDPYGQSSYSSQPAHPHHGYHTIPQTQYGDLTSLPAHQLDPLPHSLPSVTSAGKRLGGYPDDEVLNPLCINYASMAGIDMSATTPQQQQQQPRHRHAHSHSHSHSHLQTPPLTSSYTFDSGSTSPAGSLNDHFPLTPEPARLSPEHIAFL